MYPVSCLGISANTAYIEKKTHILPARRIPLLSIVLVSINRQIEILLQIERLSLKKKLFYTTKKGEIFFYYSTLVRYM